MKINKKMELENKGTTTKVIRKKALNDHRRNTYIKYVIHI
jgi:hypothetical protein